MSVASTIAERVGEHLREGEVVNLGVGIPTRVADYLPPDSGVFLQIENGMLGAGPTSTGDDVDPDLINAGKLPVSELAGASVMSGTLTGATPRPLAGSAVRRACTPMALPQPSFLIV